METGKLDPKLIQSIIQALYRLFRVGEMHAIENEAVGLSIQSTLLALRQLDRFDQDGITFIFAEDTCIVSGQLLRAPPDVYESAMEFSSFLTQTGVNSITIEAGVVGDDLNRLLRLFIDSDNAAQYLDGAGYLSPNIRLRMINPNLLFGLEDERLSPLERTLLTYALSVLVIRRLFTSIAKGGFDLAGYFKRMARQLATVNYADRPIVFDVIFDTRVKPDPAKLAVNTAIVAVAMTRRFTNHDLTLSRVCMSALLVDVGKHRPGAHHPPEQPAAVALSTAIIHMAMGSLKGDSVDRTVIAYEAQALVAGVPPDRFYPDGAHPSIDAHIISVARRFVLLVSWGLGDGPLNADAAILWLHQNAPSPLGHYCVDLLMDAIGIIPRGTCVELNSGCRGIVLQSGQKPSQYDSPIVRIFENERGEPVQPTDLNLADDGDAARFHRPVLRVVGTPSPILATAQQQLAGPLFQWLAHRKQYEAVLADYLRRDAQHRATVRSADDAAREARRTGSTAAVDPREDEFSRQSGNTTGMHNVVARTMTRSGAALEFDRRRQLAQHRANQRAAAAATAPQGSPTPPIPRGNASGIHRNAAAQASSRAGSGVHPLVPRPTSGSGLHQIPTSGSGVHPTPPRKRKP